MQREIEEIRRMVGEINALVDALPADVQVQFKGRPMEGVGRNLSETLVVEAFLWKGNISEPL